MEQAAGQAAQAGQGRDETHQVIGRDGRALLQTLREALGRMDPAADEVEAIDRLRLLEEIKGACAAAQARESTALDSLRRGREAAAGVPAAEQGQGLGAEIALARRDSANRGDVTWAWPGRCAARCRIP